MEIENNSKFSSRHILILLYLFQLEKYLDVLTQAGLPMETIASYLGDPTLAGLLQGHSVKVMDTTWPVLPTKMNRISYLVIYLVSDLLNC